jgi:RNA polymerase sigma factor (sigma-70 family)
VPATDSTTAVETVFRMEFPRVVATLCRLTNDIGMAEELAQDALVDALRQWPVEGTPASPGAWLTTVGKRKAIDRVRRDRSLAGKYAELGRTPAGDGHGGPDVGAADEDDIGDDQLRLIYVACHPLLPVAARVALTLRLVGGLSTAEIARAYVVPEATVAQRIVRAKKSIAHARVPFEVPTGDDRAARLGAVLEVLYLIFNEGYAATSGQDWVRPELSALAPQEPEVHGLLALMELQSSRLRARVGPSGTPVLLADQDRRRWDRLHIARGEAALARARQLAEAPGPYMLQAAIAACHARAVRPEETDWDQVVALYGALATVNPSPVVELNRAVAISMAGAPTNALALVEQLAGLGVLDRYHLFHSVRGDLLARTGRHREAAAAFERAAALAQNAPERRLLAGRAAGSRASAAAMLPED